MRLARPRRACLDADCVCQTAISSCAFVPVAMASVSAGVYQPMLAIFALRRT